jgi:hypothetical protein
MARTKNQNNQNLKALEKLINTLRSAIEDNGMSSELLKNAVQELSDIDIRYKYNLKRFPELINTEEYIDTSGDSPRNLAEALLWKLGKWPSYKQFASNYMSDVPKPRKTDVVFFAFANHLKDKRNPIYDQHAIRALWAIHSKLTADEKAKCRSLLFDGKDKWKQTGSGEDTIECYELFVRHINELVSTSGAASLKEIDRLLMPLGQAIKNNTNTYDEFRSLCGWPQEHFR